MHGQRDGFWKGLFVRDGVLHEGSVQWRDSTITHVESRCTWHDAAAVSHEMQGRTVLAPALVDVQINGGWGVAVEDGEEALLILAQRLVSHGVLRFCPTLVSSSAEVYAQIGAAHQRVFAAPLVHEKRAQSLGLHLEGPLLAATRPGAHQVAVIEAAVHGILDSAIRSGAVAIVTCAPERLDSIATMKAWTAAGVLVALGHSEASYVQACAAFQAGARLLTHVFNAMPSLHHRTPGLIAAGLSEPGVYISLIADGIHVHPAAAQVAIAARGAAQTLLISDASAAAGCAAGTYRLGGVDVLYDGKSVRTRDGILAGSGRFLDAMVAQAATWPSLGLARALAMASEVPAALFGARDWGRLQVGYCADLIEVDAQGCIVEVFYRGSARGIKASET